MIQALEIETTATLESLVRDYANYNAWANKTLVEWLKTKPSELMGRVVPSSFASLKETLVHIWDTQRFWLSVIRQETPPPSFRINGFHGTIEEVFNGIVDHSEEFAVRVKTFSKEQLVEPVYLKTPWFEANRSRFEYIHHTMNHSTYHRGQLITIGRNVGLTDAPMTDFNYFLLME